MGTQMLRNVLTIFILFSLLLVANIVSANSTSEDLSLNVTSLDKTLHIEDGFVVTSTSWSPDGHYLLVTCSKSISRSNNVHKHYLLDTNSHTFGEIDYGTKEFSSYSIPKVEWAPSGDKIYFRISKFAGTTGSGGCFIVCNPDGTNLRCLGTNYTDLSTTMENIGNIGFQNNLKWNPDSSKIVFEWQKPGDFFSGVCLANRNGTNAHQLSSSTNPQSVWYDSNKIIVLTTEGNVKLINESGDLIQTFHTENKDERYWASSLSPDRKKIIFASGSQTSGSPSIDNLQTYISNIDGSKLKGNFSYNEDFLANESWQPNGSLLLVNQKGNLYTVEGDENNKRLLYEGNATKPQWFPDGKRILFVENKNKLYSIDIDGANLTFITSFGLTTSYFWNVYNEAKQFSISPSGDIIAFTSALYPDTEKIIEHEPDPSTRQNIAVPLFLVNSDGSNLTRVTSVMKGKYDTFGEWSPNGKQFTTDPIYLSDYPQQDDEGSCLIELEARNSSSVWKNMPVKEIFKSQESITVDKAQINESDSTNTSQVAESKGTKNQSPSFMFLQLFICIIGVWLLHKSREI
jgi:Tol biopolymer transport system component